MVEGNKNIKELETSSFKVKELYSINPSEVKISGVEGVQISERELKKISFLKNPKDSVAVCELKKSAFLDEVSFNMVLDGIQDPGNMGTLIRLADWFGIEQIVCSKDTVDFYNPKVIQASMGSFTRVNLFYTDLSSFLAESPLENIGTDMDGENIYEVEFPEKMNLILGNEGNGIRLETENLVDKMVTIPRFGKNKSTESLNVSIAASIILGQKFRK